MLLTGRRERQRPRRKWSRLLVVLFHPRPSVQQLQDVRRRLQHTEDKVADGQKDLIQAHRSLQEQAQEQAQEQEEQRRRVRDLERRLADESREKEAAHTSSQELRAAVRRAENLNSRSENLVTLPEDTSPEKGTCWRQTV